MIVKGMTGVTGERRDREGVVRKRAPACNRSGLRQRERERERDRDHPCASEQAQKGTCRFDDRHGMVGIEACAVICG